jgi:hypothetical protein
MSGLVLHLVRKDVRQHAWLLWGWCGLLVARAFVVGAGFDAWLAALPDDLSHPPGPTWIEAASIVLGVLHLAVLAGITVLIVQADRLVGTTAFWLTRPIARVELAAAKLVTLGVWLIALPVLVDVIVVAGNGIGWVAVLNAARDSLIEHALVIVPVAALAAVTADLAAFAVGAVAASAAAIALQLLVTAQARLLTFRRPPAAEPSAIAIGALCLVAACAAALAHQWRTRRTRVTIGLVTTGVFISLVLANLWPIDLSSEPPSLEFGWVSPSEIRPLLGPTRPGTAGPAESLRVWTSTPSPRTDVVLVPLELSGSVRGHGGQPVTWNTQLARTASAVGIDVGRNTRVGSVNSALGGGFTCLNRVDSADEHPGTPVAFPPSLLDATAWVSGWSRFDGTLLIGALAYQVASVLPLERSASAKVLDGRVSILDARCDSTRAGCDVAIRHRLAMGFGAVKVPEVRYALVNRTRRQMLLADERIMRTFGYPMFGPLAEHLAIYHRGLHFRANAAYRGEMNQEWFRGAQLAVIVVRDIGAFSKPVTSEILR